MDFSEIDSEGKAFAFFLEKRAKKYVSEGYLTKCTVHFLRSISSAYGHRASSMAGAHHLLLLMLYHIDTARQPLSRRGSKGVAIV